MSTGLEVIIQYKGSKHKKLVSGALSKPAAIQLLLSDLGALRANKPAQKNIQRANSKFYLTWESAGGHKDGYSLYTTWVRIAKMKKEMNALSIESITVNKIYATNENQSAAPASRSKENTVSQNNSERDEERPLTRSDHNGSQHQHGKKYTSSPHELEPAKGHEQSSSVYVPQISENMEGLNQSSEIFDPRSLALKTLTEGTDVEILHQRPAVAPVRPYNALGLDVASLRTSAGPAKQHPSLPDRPVIVEAPLHMKPLPASIGLDVASLRTPAGPPKYPSLPDRPVIVEAPLPVKPLPASNDDAKARLTRDLWDTRKEMVALQGREIDLIAALRRLDVAQHTLEAGLARYGTADPEDRLADMEEELQRERHKRLRAERSLNKVEKECRSPFVVPALFRAFLNISEMAV